MRQRDATDLMSELSQPCPPVAVQLGADTGRQVLDQQGEETVAPAAGVMRDRGRPDAEAVGHLPDAQRLQAVARHQVGGRLGHGLSRHAAVGSPAHELILGLLCREQESVRVSLVRGTRKEARTMLPTPQLAPDLKGEALTANDPAYDEARTVFA